MFFAPRIVLGMCRIYDPSRCIRFPSFSGAAFGFGADFALGLGIALGLGGGIGVGLRPSISSTFPVSFSSTLGAAFFTGVKSCFFAMIDTRNWCPVGYIFTRPIDMVKNGTSTSGR